LFEAANYFNYFPDLIRDILDLLLKESIHYEEQ